MNILKEGVVFFGIILLVFIILDLLGRCKVRGIEVKIVELNRIG